MPALFPRWSNAVFRLLLAIGASALIGVPALLMAWVRTPFVTGQFQAPAQPMWFSHQHHVTGYRIDCRYCHTTVERSAPAGMPATGVCVPCHDQAWVEGPVFAPVRRSLATGRPIPWTRVYDLPDYVFFNHAVHVTGGIGCETCHGRVDRMDPIRQAVPLTMGWCLDCHRNPEPHLRPVSEMTTMGYRASERDSVSLDRAAREHRVDRLVTCTACHR